MAVRTDLFLVMLFHLAILSICLIGLALFRAWSAWSVISLCSGTTIWGTFDFVRTLRRPTTPRA